MLQKTKYSWWFGELEAFILTVHSKFERWENPMQKFIENFFALGEKLIYETSLIMQHEKKKTDVFSK